MGCGSWKDNCSSGLDTGSGEGELGSELLSPKEVELLFKFRNTRPEHTLTDRFISTCWVCLFFAACAGCNVHTHFPSRR